MNQSEMHAAMEAAKVERSKCEAAIGGAIARFENATGCHVSAVVLDIETLHDAWGRECERRLNAVAVNAEMPR